MNKISTIGEAQDFFLSNSGGSVIVVNSRGEEKECICYPEASEWLNSSK
jgi:hypothetical protein